MKIKDYYLDEATKDYDYDDEIGKNIKRYGQDIIYINEWNGKIEIEVHNYCVSKEIIKEIMRLSKYSEEYENGNN